MRRIDTEREPERTTRPVPDAALARALGGNGTFEDYEGEVPDDLPD